MRRIRRTICAATNRTVYDGARGDGGDKRHALGGIGDLAARARVQRVQQVALGDVDEVAAIDDFPAQVGEMGAGAGGLRPRCIDAGKLPYTAARRVAVIGGMRRCEGRVKARDRALA